MRRHENQCNCQECLQYQIAELENENERLKAEVKRLWERVRFWNGYSAWKAEEGKQGID